MMAAEAADASFPWAATLAARRRQRRRGFSTALLQRYKVVGVELTANSAPSFPEDFTDEPDVVFASSHAVLVKGSQDIVLRLTYRGLDPSSDSSFSLGRLSPKVPNCRLEARALEDCSLSLAAADGGAVAEDVTVAVVVRYGYRRGGLRRGGDCSCEEGMLAAARKSAAARGAGEAADAPAFSSDSSSSSSSSPESEESDGDLPQEVKSVGQAKKKGKKEESQNTEAAAETDSDGGSDSEAGSNSDGASDSDRGSAAGGRLAGDAGDDTSGSSSDGDEYDSALLAAFVSDSGSDASADAALHATADSPDDARASDSNDSDDSGSDSSDSGDPDFDDSGSDGSDCDNSSSVDSGSSGSEIPPHPQVNEVADDESESESGGEEKLVASAGAMVVLDVEAQEKGRGDAGGPVSKKDAEDAERRIAQAGSRREREQKKEELREMERHNRNKGLKSDKRILAAGEDKGQGTVGGKVKLRHTDEPSMPALAAHRDVPVLGKGKRGAEAAGLPSGVDGAANKKQKGLGAAAAPAAAASPKTPPPAAPELSRISNYLKQDLRTDSREEAAGAGAKTPTAAGAVSGVASTVSTAPSGGQRPSGSAAAAASAPSSPTRPLLVREFPGGVKYEVLSPGSGTQMATSGKTVLVAYEGRLAANGRQFDKGSFRFTVGAGDCVPGFDMGVRNALLNEKRRVFVPAKFGYGKQRQGPIPPNSDLVFEMTVKAIR